MVNKIHVIAKDEAHAVAEAIQIFCKETKRNVTPEEIQLVHVSEKSGLLGIGRKTDYTFTLRDELKEVEAQIASAMESLELVSASTLDGYFQLRLIPSGVYLRVVAPQDKGKAVQLDAIRQMIKQKELVDVNMAIVEKTYQDADGEFHLIAERKPELDHDASLQVKLSPDKLNAYCTYLPPLGGKRLTLLQAMEMVRDQGVCYGIHEKHLEEVVQGNSRQEFLLATGEPAENGKMAELRFHFQLARDHKRVKEREDGSVDYLNLDLVASVRRGDLLVTKIPATPGRAGRAVTGAEIPPISGKDIRLPRGKNVDIGPNEMSLFAGIDGQVFMEEDRVSVLPVYVVGGDVDLETGNIQFIGNVIVKGNVQEGFSVKAEGDVEIGGNVGAATIEAGGSVVVRKGFQGKQKGLIKANGDVHVGFIENAQVFTRGNLFVNGAIMHSDIVAKVDIVVEGRGLIVGGTVKAGNDVVAKTIGSHLATPTEVYAGVDPEVRQQLEHVNTELESVMENLDKVEKGLEQLHKLQKQLGDKYPQDKVALIQQFERTSVHLQEQHTNLVEQREMLTQQLRDQKNGRVKISDRVFPGVKIFIGQAGYRVKDSLARTAFVYDEGEVRTTPL